MLEQLRKQLHVKTFSKEKQTESRRTYDEYRKTNDYKDTVARMTHFLKPMTRGAKEGEIAKNGIVKK